MSTSTTQQPEPQVVYVEKKKGGFLKKFLIFVAVMGGLMIAGIGGCAALVGGAANEIDKEMKAEAALDRPVDVTEGAAFEHDGYAFAKGWTIAPDQFGDLTLKGLTVANESHEGAEDTPMLTFTLWDGKQNVGTIEATGNAIAQGQTSKMDALALDSIPREADYNKVTVEDAW